MRRPCPSCAWAGFRRAGGGRRRRARRVPRRGGSISSMPSTLGVFKDVRPLLLRGVLAEDVADGALVDPVLAGDAHEGRLEASLGDVLLEAGAHHAALMETWNALRPGPLAVGPMLASSSGRYRTCSSRWDPSRASIGRDAPTNSISSCTSAGARAFRTSGRTRSPVRS